MPMPVISAYDFANFVEETFADDTPLKTFYRDRVVLLTGGTGDLGQVYVEKLLRCNIKRLYLLVRPQVDADTATTTATSDERLLALLATPLFANLRKSNPRFIQLIHPIGGDLTAPGLGLSTADRSELCASVQLIVHAGAETRFDASLRAATLANVRGTRELLLLAAEMPQLRGLAHVSTLFSHCARDTVEERFYATTVEPQRMIAIAEATTTGGVTKSGADELDLLAAHIIRPWPNAYTFSMALAERLMQEATLPANVAVVVVRPSVVLSTMEDPVAGYTTSAYAINELLIAVTTGFMRVLPVRADRLAPICHAEYAVNVTLAALQRQHAGIEAQRALPAAVAKPPAVAGVYNATANHDDLRWGSVCAVMVRNAHDNPVLRSVWTPRVHLLANCAYEVWWYVWLYELLPALLVDGFLRVVGCPGRLMPRMRRNVVARQECGFLWDTERWLVCEKAAELFESLDKSDRAFFPFDLDATFDWNDYSYKLALGLKRYVLGENLNNLEQAQRRQQRFRLAHIVVLVAYYASAAIIGAVLLRTVGVCACVRSAWQAKV